MRMLIITAVFAAALSCLSTGAVAQRATRINFARGATQKTVTGYLNGYRASKTFVIRVRRGQRLTTENTGDNSITISVKPPRGSHYEQDMAADCHDRNDVERTGAGDYLITVTECRKADPFRGRFKFLVTVN